MSKSEGKLIVIEFDSPLVGTTENNEVAFTVTGQEYQYTDGPEDNGPIINRVYTVEKVERYGVVTEWELSKETPVLAGIILDRGYILDSTEVVGDSSNNLVIGKSYFAKDTSAPYYKENAFDGDINTFWRDSGTAPSWLGVDLQEASVVTKINMAGVSTRIKDFILQGSNNAESWVNIYSGQQPNDNVLITHQFENINPYRYYQIYIVNVWVPGYGAGLSELELYSSALIKQYLTEGRLITQVPITGQYTVKWLEDKPSGTAVNIKYATEGEQGPWIALENGEIISVVSNLWLSADLETTDQSMTPVLLNLWLDGLTEPTNVIRLHIGDQNDHNKNTFRNAKSLKVVYNPALGNLAGLGGPVEGLELDFIPVDLVERGNYGLSEKVTVAIDSLMFEVIKVLYSDVAEIENISIVISVTFEVTMVGNNPL